MAKTKQNLLTIDDLWRIERLGAPSLSPDGTRAVCAQMRFSMEDNKSTTSLWLLSTTGAAPRALTQCGEKDGHARFSPRGDLIGFLAKREQEGKKDETTQFYVIPPDGGEAHRVTTVATGVETFRWFPDGKRIAFVSWVWPELTGEKAQAKRHKEWTERKESGYATSEALHRYWDHLVPMDRVPHLHVLEIDTGRVRDLFEGTDYELTRGELDANAFDISPDGRRIVFAWDPAAEKRLENCFALAEVEVRSGRIQPVVQDPEWDLGAPRYNPAGDMIAFLAKHQQRRHTMPRQLALWERSGSGWEVVSAEWDHAVNAPLHWEEDGQALLFTAEQRGRQHLWRFDLPDRRAEVVVQGGWMYAFDKASGVLVSTADALTHPARVHAHLPGEAPRRLENFNDDLLNARDLGHHEEVWFKGAQDDDVQMWLSFPPGFDERKKYPLLHVIHGGPHAVFGDTWHYRWNHTLFAAQGYVVASVNYHGSSGFGYAFLDSITHRWGELELHDIEAATDRLLKRSWADPARVFASGGSYGGYMVAWMNGHVPPGRYAAYICHAGCFDWTAMFAGDAWGWHSKELGAWYWDDAQKTDSQNPRAWAQHLHTPTLVIHGAKDYRVPDAQGLSYYNTLKARGVDARLLWFPDENHWIVKPRNSKLWYGEFFDWLTRHGAQKEKAEKKDKDKGKARRKKDD